ncbi:hypothetical protein DPMN_089588 [Dreissena polymorpha]|uniref:Uncharacterized protein n=1 Tax=Dreissena polymorpha TaxID=45954 RepID=A0A9D4KX32_DREPO|nr:hypothetical protein DPMN_089588 [Dreissena polymorpha]
MVDAVEAEHTGIYLVAKTPSKHINIATDFLSDHSISGCNVVAGYLFIGTGTFIQMLNAGNSIRLLGDMTACMTEIMKEATCFV